MSLQPVSATDFSGGFTDYYVAGPPNKYRKADNFLINRHGAEGKLITRPGSVLWSSAHPQLPTGGQRIGFLRFFQDTLFANSSRDLYYFTTDWVSLLGPTSNKLFPAGTTVDDVISSTRWSNTLFVTHSNYATPSKIYPDNSNTFQLRTAGLPPLASVPTVGGAGTKAQVYIFIYEYTYQVKTLTFKDLGPTVEVAITNGGATNSISAIPVLANGVTTNYDTAAIKVGIYRTIDLGAVFYKVGEVTNGTTTFSDTVTDAALINNEPLYTEGGVVENDPPPPCKFVHVVGNVGYWANIKEGTEIRANRVRQSIPGDIDSVPGDFFVDIDDDIAGMSSARDVPIVLGDKSAWRLDGVIDELGRGELTAQKISDTCSCISGQSVVQTLEGVFWAGIDGFYFTDGYTVVRINEDWDVTYASFVQNTTQTRRIQGKYDNVHRRVWWTIQSDPALEVDLVVVLDLRWGVRPDSSFTTCSGAANFAPSAIEFDSKGNLVRGDKRGYVFLHNDDLRSDPLVDTLTTPANWLKATIPYNFISCALNMGTDAVRKYATWFSIQCANRSNLSVQPISINDDGRVVENLQPIRFKGNVIWGDEEITWGDPSVIWDKEGLIEVKRRFPAKSLRWSYKQIQLTNAYSVIDTSDLLGTADINAALTQVTLNDASASFATTYPGYYIAFQDDLTKDYLITAVATDILTYADPDGTSATAVGQKFEIKGYPKNEIIDLLSMTIWYDAFGTTQEAFQTTDLGTVSE